MSSTPKAANSFSKEIYNRIKNNGKYAFVSAGSVKSRTITGAVAAWFDPATRDVTFYPNVKLAGNPKDVEAFYTQYEDIVGTGNRAADLGVFYDRGIFDSPYLDNFRREYEEASQRTKLPTFVEDLGFYVENLAKFKPRKATTRRPGKTLETVMQNVERALDNHLTMDSWADPEHPAKLVNVSNLEDNGEGAVEISGTSRTTKFRHHADTVKSKAIKAVTIPGYDYVVSRTENGVKNFLKLRGLSVKEGEGRATLREWVQAFSGQTAGGKVTKPKAVKAAKEPKEPKEAACDTEEVAQPKKAKAARRSKSPPKSPKTKAAPRKAKAASPKAKPPSPKAKPPSPKKSASPKAKSSGPAKGRARVVA